MAGLDRPATDAGTAPTHPGSTPPLRAAGGRAARRCEPVTPDEAKSLGRAIRAARIECGVSQLKLAVAIGISGGQMSLWERGRVPAARGRDAYPPTIPRDQLAAIADVLDCTVASIVDRAALSATTRVLYGLEPLGPARTLVAGREFDLTDAEADRVADFIAGLIAARELG